LTSWIAAHGEAIFGTRPFTVFGEGAPDVMGSGNFNEGRSRALTAKDIRFTTKGDLLYATLYRTDVPSVEHVTAA
jgi:alpha-L-fucosidase